MKKHHIDLFLKAIRNQWSVENKLHWHLDFTFREDKNITVNKKSINEFAVSKQNYFSSIK